MRVIETSLPHFLNVHTATCELTKVNIKMLYIFIDILTLHDRGPISFLLFSKHFKLGMKMGKKKPVRWENGSQ